VHVFHNEWSHDRAVKPPLAHLSDPLTVQTHSWHAWVLQLLHLWATGVVCSMLVDGGTGTQATADACMVVRLLSHHGGAVWFKRPNTFVGLHASASTSGNSTACIGPRQLPLCGPMHAAAVPPLALSLSCLHFAG
jgi:hypothetical protein